MEFVNFSIAKKLKEKGFTCQYPIAMYNELGSFHALYTSADHNQNIKSVFGNREYYDYDDFDDKDCVCPTISQVLKWLRKEKKIHLIVEISDSGWYYTLYPNVRWENDKLKSDKYIMSFKHKVSWEQAALAGIECVIDNIL